jgi:hypothetical protein
VGVLCSFWTMCGDENSTVILITSVLACLMATSAFFLGTGNLSSPLYKGIGDVILQGFGYKCCDYSCSGRIREREVSYSYFLILKNIFMEMNRQVVCCS